MTYKNILIVKLSAIGDVIHALPVAHALKQTYPEARITWVVEKPAYDLLTNNPDIDEIIIFDKPKFKSLTGLLSNGYTF
ncbi:MAG: lipopolysaccharide heptosyltransferase, partial [Firmicutes bacterium]|nr:lipopolysaccharide heptosyltransferase [Bacillota bacterium]